MTERQGGSDVRANITRAEPVGDGAYEIHGHKWFCSYPPCDVFLVLAQAPGGLSCFLVERGPGMEFQRLKDKLGTRSLPSSEVEFRGIRGRLVGEEGRGVPAIIRMVNHTRLDCLLGATTGLRRGTLEAIHHARHRSAFGALLVDQPAMRNVLADLAIESEAATVVGDARRARLRRATRPAFRRFATAVMKYWVCKRAAGARRRGARVPGRQRLRRGLGDAAALPRRAAELDLGGLGQRRRARRAAGDGQGARGPAGVPGRVRAGRRRRPAARRPPRARARAQPARCSPADDPQFEAPADRRGPRASRCRRRCSCATRRRRSPTRSAPRGSPARAAASTARCRRRRRRGDHRPRAAGREPSSRRPVRVPAGSRGSRSTGPSAATGSPARCSPSSRRRRARRPRSGRPRAAAGRRRQGLLRRLRPGRVAEGSIGPTEAPLRPDRRSTRGDGGQPRPVATPGTRWSTTR